MYEWAAAIIRESYTEELIDKQAVMALLEEHRAGDLDHSRRIWALIVFMLWHGIFVEGRIRPHIPEPQYPVRL
jgi:asparagine synthase (glutamine-hydrolysing)